VTPEHRQRPQVNWGVRRREGSFARNVSCEDDIMTDQNVPNYSDRPAHHRPEKRSLFSQLGQWLCQSAAQDSLSITDPTLLTCERNSPVISLPVPGDLQYRLQYTTVNNRGRRQIEDTGLTNHRFPNQCGNGHSQNRNRNVKMWTPLGRASVKISCITQRI